MLKRKLDFTLELHDEQQPILTKTGQTNCTPFGDRKPFLEKITDERFPDFQMLQVGGFIIRTLNGDMPVLLD